MTGPDKASRSWRLRGYRKGDKDAHPHHESTVVGDRALDEAMARLESDPAIVRIAVKATG